MVLIILVPELPKLPEEQPFQLATHHEPQQPPQTGTFTNTEREIK